MSAFSKALAAGDRENIKNLIDPIRETDEREIPKGLAVAAASKLGYTTQLMQEKLSDMATDPLTYPDYLKAKKSILNRIRASVLRTFDEVAGMYMSTGMDEKAAIKRAEVCATEVDKILMGVYEEFFPKARKDIEIKRTW